MKFLLMFVMKMMVMMMFLISESIRVADCLVTGMQETLVFHATDGVGTATGSITVDILETVRMNCIYTDLNSYKYM